MDTAADRGPGGASYAPVPPGPGVTPRSAGTEPHEASFLEPLERVFASMRRIASAYAQLAITDAQRAAVQLAWLVGAGILISVLVVTAWLAGVVALAVWLFGEGLSWPSVLIVAALLNLVGAGLVVWRMKGVFSQSPFAATLNQLKSKHASVQPNEPEIT
jgi:uncharacterized membrane protein YqjE